MPSFPSKRLVGFSTRFLLAAIALSSMPFWVPLAASAEEGIRLSGGLRIVSVTPGKQPAPAAPSLARGGMAPAATSLTSNVPPLEGPQTYVVMTVTDERASDDLDWVASAHAGLDGSLLPGATTNPVLAIFDSGGGSDLVSYPDAVGLGLQGAYLSGSTFPVQGIVGSLDMEMSVPVGFFVHGIQDLDANGQIVPALTFGQGNFVGLVNTLDNYLAGDTIPTILGTTFFAYFAAYVQHSQRIDAKVAGRAVSTAAVTIYASPTDPQIPILDKRILLEIRPGSSGLVVTYLSLLETPLLPSLLSGDSSLFFTANNVTLHEGAKSASGSMAVDTGSQATLISVTAATALGLNLLNPDFEVEVQGIGSATATAPGFYIDELSIPVTINQSGISTNEVWNHVPIVVINAPSPEGGNLFGILGMNLLANRDYVFNGALPSGPFDDPYLDITDPFIAPEIRITDIRLIHPDTVGIDWLSQPAAPVLFLESATNLVDLPVVWSLVATGDLPTITGTMIVTGLQNNAFFRINAP